MSDTPLAICKWLVSLPISIVVGGDLHLVGTLSWLTNCECQFYDIRMNPEL